MDKLRDEDLNVVGESVDSATVAKPVNEVACRLLPGEFAAKIIPHISGAVNTSDC